MGFVMTQHKEATMGTVALETAEEDLGTGASSCPLAGLAGGALDTYGCELPITGVGPIACRCRCS